MMSLKKTWYAAAAWTLSLLLAGAAHAQTFDGNNDVDGGDGTSFTDPLNWDGDDVPNTTAEDAIIDPGAAWDVLLDATLSVRDLTVGTDDMLSIASGRTLTVAGGDIMNDGVITVNSDASVGNTLLTAGSALLIDGTGVITLNASSDGALQHAALGTLNGWAITNAATHTIDGTGQIVTFFTNQGLVHANVAGRTLRLQNNNKTNTGTLKASNGGTLSITTVVDNTGGQILADNGTVELDGATISNGTIDGANGGTVEMIGGSTLNNVTLNAPVNVSGGVIMTVNGTIVNNDTITVNDTAAVANTRIDPNSPTLFTGTGEIVLNASGDGALQHGQLSSINEHLVTNDVNHTIRGTGDIVGPLTNDGLISADVNGRVLRLSGNPKTNNSTIEAINGSTLHISANINNAGAQINTDASTIELSSTTIDSGTINATNGGTVEMIAGSTLNNVTLNAPVNVSGGVVATVNGTIVNNNTITVNDTAAIAGTRINPDSPTLFTGTGEIVLNASSDGALQHGQLSSINEFVITNDVNHTIRGTGDIVGPLTNDGLVSADVNGRTLRLSSNPKTNNAIMRAINGATLRINATINNAGGLILADGGTVELNGTTINNGTINAANGGMTNMTGGSTFNSVTLNASLDVAPGVVMTVNGTIVNNGTLTVNDSGNLSNTRIDPGTPTLFTGTGEIVLNAPSDGAPQHAQISSINEFVITNDVNHTIRGTGDIVGPLTNNGLVSADVNGRTLRLSGNPKTNNGTFRAANGGTLNITFANFGNDGILDAQAGSTIMANGTLTNNTTGVIRGEGDVDPSVELVNNGTIAPGASPGTLTISGDVVNSNASVLAIEIAGAVEGVTADLLQVSGDFDVDGVLQITFLPGAQSLLSTDEIRIVAAESLSFSEASQMFDAITFASGTSGLFDIDYYSDSGEIVLSNFSDVVVPEPTSLALVALGGLAALRRRRR